MPLCAPRKAPLHPPRLAMLSAVFNPRRRSLARGTVLVLASLAGSLALCGFPSDHGSSLLLIPLLLAVWGTIETVRCLQRRWSLYHGAVMVLLYSDVLALFMILFLLVYPYTLTYR